MSEDREIKERILRKAQDMFMQYGFSKITMDELASSLGISKKTLYKYYDGKDQIIKEIVTTIKCNNENCVDSIMRNTELDFIEKLKLLLEHIGTNASKMRGPMIEEIQKYYPQIWEDILEFRRKGAYDKFSLLIKEGVKKGSFRKDINREILTLVYLNAINGILDPDVLKNLPYTGTQVFETIVKIIMEGILTEEGRAKYIGTKTSHIRQNFQELIKR